MKLNKYLAISLAAALVAGSSAVIVSAAPEESLGDTYVLMNIPYDEFYKADLNNDVKVDVFTSATKIKTRGTLSAGSYHESNTGEKIDGVTFPVKVSKDVDLSKFKQVTDSDSYDITVTNRGKETTTTYAGKEALFENPTYSYYVLSETPSFYKELTVNADGSFSFGKTVGEAVEVKAEADFTKDSKYGDYQLNLTSEELQNVEKVYGVIISTKEGNDYGLRHMENIWRNTALAWSTGYTTSVHSCPTSSDHYKAMAGQTIDKVTYYTSDGIKTVSNLSIYVDPNKYALMNIPYSDFYANEVENEVPVDIYSSATKSKTLGSLVAGSYHVNADGSDITGVIYPVKLGDGVDLSKYKKVTDTDKYEVTTSGRGATSTTVYEGKDSLFLGDSYSYYILNELPAYYKTVSADESGKLEFSQDKTTATALENVKAEISTNTSYGDYQVDITSEELQKVEKVFGVVFETKEGASYGFRHMENIWKNTEIAWSTGFTTSVHGSPTSSDHYKAIMGQTINKVTYFTSDGIKTFTFDDASALYVPVKTGASAEVANAAVADGSTTFTTDKFADDFDYSYVVTDSDDKAVEVTVDNGTIKYPTDSTNGKYTLIISDKSGKYASVSAGFELTVSATAQFNGNIFANAPALTAADGVSAEEFAAYLEAVSKVTVGENSYAASGRGAVAIIDAETGAIDTSNTDVFAEDVNEFEITVEATGYEPLTFTLSRTEAPAEEPTEEPTDDPTDEPAEDPTDEPADEPTDEEPIDVDPADEPVDDTDDAEPADDNNVGEPETPVAVTPVDNNNAPQNVGSNNNGSAVQNADGVSVPQTADYTAVGAILAVLAASAGAIAVLRRRKTH